MVERAILTRTPTALALFAEAVADDPMAAAALAGFAAGIRARTLDDRVKIAGAVALPLGAPLTSPVS